MDSDAIILNIVFDKPFKLNLIWHEWRAKQKPEKPLKMNSQVHHAMKGTNYHIVFESVTLENQKLAAAMGNQTTDRCAKN